MGVLHDGLSPFMILSSLILLRMGNISDKSCRENQNTHFVFGDFSSKNVSFMRKCGKILWSGAGHRWQYGACALHAGYLRLQTHTLMLYNTHCFSTTTTAAVTRLHVTLYAHCLSGYFCDAQHEVLYVIYMKVSTYCAGSVAVRLYAGLPCFAAPSR